MFTPSELTGTDASSYHQSASFPVVAGITYSSLMPFPFLISQMVCCFLHCALRETLLLSIWDGNFKSIA